MRTTVTIDGNLLKAASKAPGTSEPSVVLCETLRALIERDAMQRLGWVAVSPPRLYHSAAAGHFGARSGV